MHAYFDTLIYRRKEDGCLTSLQVLEAWRDDDIDSFLLLDDSIADVIMLDLVDTTSDLRDPSKDGVRVRRDLL